jgi:hypothetical protein
MVVHCLRGRSSLLARGQLGLARAFSPDVEPGLFFTCARVASGIASMTDVVYGLNDDAMQALARYMATRP